MSNEVKRYIVASKDAHDFDLERIGPLAHERLMVCDTDYAALEAECERWKERCQYNADTAHAVATERDALAAELAAIRAAGGEVEVMEVVAYLLPDYAISRRLSTYYERKIGEPLMTVAQHSRTVAAMAAELERVRQGSLFLLDAHAELEAARKQEPIKLSEDVREYLQEGINSATQCEDADMDYDFANELGKLLGPLYALPPLAGQASVPDVCDGHEQEAFEAFAKREGMDTSMHPMHWLFLNRETYAARQGWKAAIRYCRALLATPSMEVKS